MRQIKTSGREDQSHFGEAIPTIWQGRETDMDGGFDKTGKPSVAQRKWLERGLTQPGGKLPLFDSDGRKVNPAVIKKCIDVGWAEPWFANQMKPDWLVCKLTVSGRLALTSPDHHIS